MSEQSNVDLSVDIGGIPMRNPVMTASGTFGYGPEYADLVNLESLGAVVVKGICMERTEGNPTPRIVETPSGLLNAIGLPGPGADGFIDTYMPFLREQDVPVIVNIWGRTVEEYIEVAARFDDVQGVAGLELNISCPNIKEGGITFGTDPRAAAEVIGKVRAATRLPLIPKLSPNVSDITEFARIAEAEGSDAIAMINSVPGMVIDVKSRKPAIANGVGGLTGPAVRPIAVRLVWQAASVVKIPIIGMGGIACARDAVEFLVAGASAVAVGTATFVDPLTSLNVVSGIEDYLRENGMSSVGELVGTLQYP